MASIFQVSAILIASPQQKMVLLYDFAISLLHQRFTFVHLFNTYLPYDKGFSLSVHHLPLTRKAAQGDLTTLPVIVLPMGLSIIS